MTSAIIRPKFYCADCQPGAPLYISPRNYGPGVEIVHACEHIIRRWYPDAPEQLTPAGTQPGSTICYGKPDLLPCEGCGQPLPVDRIGFCDDCHEAASKAF